ncbi:hypothetical protein MCUN1_002587 [Malassezia cuniculi]|uniref:Uncharacterized protein n=1 Tax=Malassezia cuniculi TaxID=948313 RepID=A0AAF0EWQ7_9BASI|nr:hypothetical protein MCUN1_002587 [Malassezia cuniculi]
MTLADILLSEDREHTQTLGICLEYVIEHSVLAELLGLCAADEPEGVMRELILMCARLVHGMGTHFLTHNGNAQALTQLIHHGMCRRDSPSGMLGRTETTVADALLLLVQELMCRLADTPQLMLLYLELSPPSSREEGRLELLTFLTSHVLSPAWAGFYARGALAVLVRQQAQLASEGHKYAVRYLLGADLPEALTAAASAAYGLLPTHIELEYTEISGLASHIIATRKYKCCAAIHLAPQGAVLQLCALIDTLWLIEQVLDACSISGDSDVQDMFEQLQTDVLHAIRTAFVERILAPAAGAAAIADQSAAAVILYHTCMLQVLRSSGKLVAAICRTDTDQRDMYELLTDAMRSDTDHELQSLAFYAAALHSRCIATADSRDAPAYIPPLDAWPITSLAAIVQSLQSLHFSAALGARYDAHLSSVLQTWSAENSDESLQRVYALGSGRVAFRPRTQVCISGDDYFIAELLERLLHFFTFEPSSNLRTIDTISALCRIPFLSMQGLFCGPAPIITFVLYMLSLQAQAYINNVPDLAFFLGQRKNQSDALRVSSRSAQKTDTLQPSFLPDQTVDDALKRIENEYINCGWMPSPDARSLMTSAKIETRTQTSEGTFTHGAPQLYVSVKPCAPRATGQWSALSSGFGIRAPLSELLDNMILLEEAIIEFVCILYARRIHGCDLYIS